MSKSFLEWVVAIATVASGVFVGTQAYYTRELLRTPFEANKQIFLLEGCQTFFSESAIFADDLRRARTISSYLAEIPNREAEEQLGLKSSSDKDSIDLREMVQTTLLPGCNLDRALEFWSNPADSIVAGKLDVQPICSHTKPESLSALVGVLAKLEAVSDKQMQEEVSELISSLDSYTYQRAILGKDYSGIVKSIAKINSACRAKIHSPAE